MIEEAFANTIVDLERGTIDLLNKYNKALEAEEQIIKILADTLTGIIAEYRKSGGVSKIKIANAAYLVSVLKGE